MADLTPPRASGPAHGGPWAATGLALLVALALLGLASCATRGLRTPPSSESGVDRRSPPSAADAPTPGDASGAPNAPQMPGVPLDVVSADAADAAPARVALPVDTPEPVRRFVTAAMQMLGQPYRRAGSAPGGFDCSGLVAYAGRRIGLVFPRTAREQQRTGTAVARTSLEPGDLVFMRLRGRQHHVGIMIDASHFVHAPSTGGRVRVDSLDVKPYAKRILALRRPDFPR